MSATYKEQYNRMRRWYDRFGTLAQGRPHDMPSDNYLDEIHSFFLNCYHLKDWIKNDPTVATRIRAAVEEYVNSNRALRICSDLCNSLKHLHRDRSDRSHESPHFGKKEFSLHLGSGPAIVRLRYEVATDAGPIDAFTLAGECIEAWDAFLTARMESSSDVDSENSGGRIP